MAFIMRAARILMFVLPFVQRYRKKRAGKQVPQRTS